MTNKYSKNITLIIMALVFFVRPAFSEDDNVLRINSTDKSDHYGIMLELSTASWRSAQNSRGTTCKYYRSSVSLDEIKSIVSFEYDDLKEVVDDKYGASSDLWKTCNYLLFAGDSSELLNWFAADLVIDVELAVLLLRNIDNEEKLFEALYIYKPRQNKSNNEIESQSLWKDLINLVHSLIWGHPKVDE